MDFIFAFIQVLSQTTKHSRILVCVEESWVEVGEGDYMEMVELVAPS